jgi:drug/metabolite transporter (DMT)-like permease
MNTLTLSLPQTAVRWLHAPQAGLVAATLLWSGNFVVGRAIQGQVEPLVLNFWRWAIAAAVLAPLAWRAFAAQWPVLRAHWRYIAALGFTGLALPHTCSYYALQGTSPVNALLILMLMPILVALLAWRWFGQPLRRAQWAGIALPVAGAAWILARGDWAVLVQLRFSRSDLWMLPAVLGSSAHMLLLKRTPAGATQGPLLLASMLAALLQMAAALPWVAGASELAAIAAVWPAAMYVGVFASAAAFLCWNRGVVQMGPARAAPFMYLMPLYASGLSALFLGDAVRPYQACAGALVLAGLWLARDRP